MKKNEVVYALARENYCAYTVMVHKGKWIAGRLHRYLCDTVQGFIQRPTTTPYEVLCLSVPPQHGKSQSITETLPSWYLGNYPDRRVIEVSYNDDFAGKFGRRNRRKIEEYGAVAFGIQLGAKAADREFEIKGYSGGMISRGIMSGVTGNPADLIIIDDPIKNRQEADSPTYRERLFDEWENSIKTRTQAGAKIIVIQTRWNEGDLIGQMLLYERDIAYINIPCEAEENDPLGREIGQALCPEIGKGAEWLRQFKESYQSKSGARAWNALFQGRPSAIEGNLVKREWWKYYDTAPVMDYIILSVDAAFKDAEDNDFVAIQAWGKSAADMYLLDAVKKHLDFPATLSEIRLVRGKFPKACAVYVEDKANGSAIIQMLRREIPCIVPVNPEGGKVARVNAVSPAIESGNVYLPRHAGFTGDFVDEFAAFPNGAHDDQVDAASQALNKLIYFFKTIQREVEVQPFHTPKPKSNKEMLGGKIDVV